MNKATELLRLREFATNFPQDSYLGPWLRAVYPEIERSVTSDIIPHVTFLDEKEKVHALREEASILRATVERATAENQALATAAHSLRADVNVYKRRLREMAEAMLLVAED